MAVPLVILLALCGVCCLAPFSMYLAWLAMVNRRPRTTILEGKTDLLALFVGLSGFLGIGGIVLIALVHSNARFAVRGNWEQIQAAWGQEQSAWLLIAGLYFLVVFAFGSWLVLSRARTLVIFNSDRWILEQTLDELLVDLGKVATRTGRLWTDGQAILEVIHFEGMLHATIKLLTGDRRLGEEIERGLRMRLAHAPEVDNPAATWLLWAAITCLMFMTGCLFLVLYYLYLVRR